MLYEGYLLYPYRASAAKNHVRWQWGVLMPPSFAAHDEGEHADCQAQCLVEAREGTTLHVRLRFLHAQARDVLAHGRKVPSVTVGDSEYLSWDEAVEREIDVVTPLEGALTRPFTVPGGEEFEPVADGIELRRRTRPLSGVVEIRTEPLTGPYGGIRLTVRVTNTSGWTGDTRDEALHHALVAAHVALGVDSGHFLSLLDPPEWAGPATEACVNTRLWPVLIGPDVMLASPIILYDNPVIASESPGAMFDGLEIDEILTLRTMALTEEEKREARATDRRAREIIDRADGMPSELMDRLHGAIRGLREVTGEPETPPWWDPGADASVSPETDHVVVAGVPIAAGSRVRLRPRLSGTDAQDMFLTGQTATVHAVLSDVDGDTHLAVTVDDDPAAELQYAHGRYRYFSPDEIEVLP
ncbi:MAG TPA: hypothetical protein VJ870_10215 [Amycolatopsis sp.]|nr:hypothetical protein [Amycolatopsis sp.]